MQVYFRHVWHTVPHLAGSACGGKGSPDITSGDVGLLTGGPDPTCQHPTATSGDPRVHAAG
jgi:hypothetical protein